jgi:hypothetical protein
LVWPLGVVMDVWAVWGRCFVARAQKHKKKPCKSAFTWRERQRGSGRGLAWPLVWTLGCVVDVEGGVVTVSSPEYTRMKKSPVNAGLQGY